TVRKTLAYRIKIARPQTAPAITSKRVPPSTSLVEAFSTQVNTQGTAAHKKMSVPPQDVVNSSGVESAINKPAHFHAPARFILSLKNGYARIAQPHQPSMVDAAASKRIAVASLPRKASIAAV